MSCGFVLSGNQYFAKEFEMNNKPDGLVFIAPEYPVYRCKFTENLILPNNLEMEWEVEKGDWNYFGRTVRIKMKNITLQEISQPSIYSAAAFINLFISKSKDDLNLLYIEALETLVKELRAQLEEKES